jgi:CheY-like chemotaxis protein
MAGRILVADDSPDVREVLQMNLETMGYEVLLASDGDQALERFYQERPDLLILDVMMPKQNGFQICRKVKSDPTGGNVPVILLTAKSGREDMYWGRDCGADEYVTKPFSTKELEGIVERLLARRVGTVERATGSLEDEMERRRAAGESGGICILRWDVPAMDVFRKKYGEVKYAECLDRLRKEVEGFVDSEAEEGKAEFLETMGFRILLAGERDEIESFSEELCTRLTRLARSFYLPADRQKKAIEVREFKTKLVRSVPLVSFSSELNFYGD